MICPMSSEDIEEVSEIEKASFSRPWTKKNFEESLNLSDAFFIVFKDDDTNVIMGYLGMYFSPDEMGIMNVAVSPKYRRCGVADALLKKAMDTASEKKVSYVYLEVRKTNIAAINLYEKHGLKALGIRKGLYEDPKEDGIVMGKDI